MKKLIAMLLTLTMLFAAIPVFAENTAGGWTVTADITVTDDASAALNAATANLMGCSYEAVALLGTQLVAGTNYQLLCRLTPVVPDAAPHYAIVTVWQKLDGTAELLNVMDLYPELAAE